MSPPKPTVIIRPSDDYTEDWLQFRYVNWRGEEHIYKVELERIDFGQDPTTGQWCWLMHAHVVTRDDRPHPGRRTFRMDTMKDVIARA